MQRSIAPPLTVLMSKTLPHCIYTNVFQFLNIPISMIHNQLNAIYKGVEIISISK